METAFVLYTSRDTLCNFDLIAFTTNETISEKIWWPGFGNIFTSYYGIRDWCLPYNRQGTQERDNQTARFAFKGIFFKSFITWYALKRKAENTRKMEAVSTKAKTAYLLWELKWTILFLRRKRFVTWNILSGFPCFPLHPMTPYLRQ